MFNYDDLYECVFDKKIDANKLIIITGYIGPAIIEDLNQLPYDIEIYVGMYGNNISKVLHTTLLSQNNKKIEINYTKVLIHAKCYIWLKDCRIIKSLIGSANFSMNGLKTPFKEVLGDLPYNTYSQLSEYVNYIKNHSYSIEKYSGHFSSIAYIDENTKTISDIEVEVSLLASRTGGKKNILGQITYPGDVHKAGGLNWGFSNGEPLPNDAYIKIPIELIRKNPLMFPPKNNESNEYVDVIWDDGTRMQMLLEGTQTVDDIEYPKQISTYKSKKELGLYLRKRIGDAIGIKLIIPTDSKDEFRAHINLYKDKLITKEMLKKYGRNSINIKLIGEGTYYFDFSRKDREGVTNE